MTPTVVSSVRPVALLVDLVYRHAFPRPVGGPPRRRATRRLAGAAALRLASGGGALYRLVVAAVRLARSAVAALLSLLSPTFAFRAWLWVLWDERHGCSGPQSRLSESAGAGSVAGISNPCPQLFQ